MANNQLLQEIIDLAVDDKAPLSVLLRKCLVLATKLRNERLKEWASSELNGYPDQDKLPAYRQISVHAKGNFYGPFGAAIRNANLPSIILSKEHRLWAEKTFLTQPIAAYDKVIADKDAAKSGSVSIAWPPNLVMMYQEKFYDGYSLAQAWQVIPTSAIVGMADTIRNRILSFALEIESDVAAVEEDFASVPQATVNQHVTAIIYGGNQVFSSATQGLTQIGEINVGKGDLQALLETLDGLGLGKAEAAELKAILEHEPANAKEPSPKVQSWLVRALTHVGKEGVKVGSDVARAGITKALFGYLGLGG